MNTKREFWQRNVVAVVGMLVFSGNSYGIGALFSFGIRDNGYCGYY